MILDERTEFCDATALNTGGANTYLLGDQIDLGSVARDVGNGQPLYLVIQAAANITAGASGTVQFHLASDDTASISTSTSTRHFSTAVLDSAGGIAAGTVLAAVALPMEGLAYERYLGILQTTAVAAITAGSINAFLTPDVAKWKAYPDAIN